MIPWLSESRVSGRNPFFWSGLAIYALSYFLIAVNDQGMEPIARATTAPSSHCSALHFSYSPY
jgi:hypothetical protein